MKKTIIFLILGLLLLLGVSTFFWFYQVRYFVGRASVSQATYSPDNSYLFVSPLRAQANLQEQVRVTVFILDARGLGVLGKKISLVATPDLSVAETQNVTDNLGRSIFDVSSSKAGDYYLDVRIDDNALPQKAHLSFY